MAHAEYGAYFLLGSGEGIERHLEQGLAHNKCSVSVSIITVVIVVVVI